MSTNYYIHKKNRLPREDLIHIGKVVVKKPKGEFIWDTLLSELYNIEQLEKIVVVDEYGKEYSYVDFAELIGEMDWNYEHIGTEFS